MNERAENSPGFGLEAQACTSW